MSGVAFVLDPFPTRNSISALSLVALRMIAIAQKMESRGMPAALICAGALTNDIRKRIRTSIAMFNGAYATREPFLRAQSSWDEDDIALWRRINFGDELWTDLYHRWLSDVIRREYDFDTAVVWGNNASLVTALRRCGKEVLVFELGPMRPPMADIVTYAHNATLPTQVIPQSVFEDPNRLAAALPSIVDQEKIGDLSNETSLLIHKSLHWNEYFAEVADTLPKGRKILFAGQLYDDSNAAYWSRDPSDVIEELMELTLQHGASLIVKPHPDYRTIAVNERHWRSLRRKWERAEHVVEIAPDARRSGDVLGMVNGVVAGNSSMLYEAMFYNLPVHAFGSTYFLPEKNLLSLEDVVSGRYDKREYRRCLAVVRNIVWNEKCVTSRAFDEAESLHSALLAFKPSPKGGPVLSANRGGLPPFSRLQGVKNGTLIEKASESRIVLDGGVSLDIVTDQLKCNFETLEVSDGVMSVRGWCLLDESRAVPAFYALMLKPNTFMVTSEARPRLDVARFWREEDALMCGFEFRIQLQDADLAVLQEGHLYAYVGQGKVQRIALKSFNGGTGFYSSTLS